MFTLNKIYTAAHCIQNKNETKPLDAKDLFVILGGYDLNEQFEVGRQTMAVEKIKVHPDWNLFDDKIAGDIAIITLHGSVDYSEYIRPVCIPMRKMNVSMGTIEGWERSKDNNLINNLPRKVETQILSEKNCVNSSTFCTRQVDVDTFPDSGSGFYVKYGFQYYLKGIVSMPSISMFTEVYDYKEFITNESSVINSGLIGASKSYSIDVECVDNISL